LKVKVTVKPGSKRGPYVQLGLDGSLLVCVKEPALEGKANKAVITELSKYYEVPKSAIELKTGSNSKHKIFEISNQ
jgi:uncharacterized protein (TIGR00251 family)